MYSINNHDNENNKNGESKSASIYLRDFNDVHQSYDK